MTMSTRDEIDTSAMLDYNAAAAGAIARSSSGGAAVEIAGQIRGNR